MTYNCLLKIADHLIGITTSSSWVQRWIADHYPLSNDLSPPDLFLHIEDGYGRPFESFEVHIDRTEVGACYIRTDYRLDVSSDYRHARMQVHDELALKHAMLNLYSAFIVHFEWGLLIHSSCIVDRTMAHLFAGRSGKGKSTVACLSAPRLVLSDEVSLVCVPKEGEARVFDSPFRSDSVSDDGAVSYILGSVYLLNQSEQVRRSSIPSPDAFRRLIDNVFYWAHDPEETAKVIHLIERLAQFVPAYDLYFQKNDSFWGLIS